jgi:hypothetical protein
MYIYCHIYYVIPLSELTIIVVIINIVNNKKMNIKLD